MASFPVKNFVSTSFCFVFVFSPLLVELLNFNCAREQVDKMGMT